MISFLKKFLFKEVSFHVESLDPILETEGKASFEENEIEEEHFGPSEPITHFDQFAECRARDLQIIASSIEDHTLVDAISNAQPAIKKNFLRAYSRNRREELTFQIENKSVSTLRSRIARARIVAIANRFWEEGRVSLQRRIP